MRVAVAATMQQHATAEAKWLMKVRKGLKKKKENIKMKRKVRKRRLLTEMKVVGCPQCRLIVQQVYPQLESLYIGTGYHYFLQGPTTKTRLDLPL